MKKTVTRYTLVPFNENRPLEKEATSALESLKKLILSAERTRFSKFILQNKIEGLVQLEDEVGGW
ncbi:MAG: hypothetical protein HXS48_15750 [Theionarchaea archaeon]|nr:hypothetical protein [Theionarchaea archaeon]